MRRHANDNLRRSAAAPIVAVMTILKRIALGGAALTLGACSTFGVRSGTEQPDYAVVETIAGRGGGEDVEIRGYPPRLAAEVVVEGDEASARTAGFRKLAAFIFGDNRADAKIAMTAPVAQSDARAPASEKIAMTAPVAQSEAGAGRWTVRFFMPGQYTRETLPQPLDPDIEIVEVPGETMAVLRFSGSRSPDAVDDATRRLRAIIEDSAWTISGPPAAYFYDPPWTLPFLRRNEVAVPVTPAKPPAPPPSR